MPESSLFGLRPKDLTYASGSRAAPVQDVPTDTREKSRGPEILNELHPSAGPETVADTRQTSFAMNTVSADELALLVSYFHDVDPDGVSDPQDNPIKMNKHSRRGPPSKPKSKSPAQKRARSTASDNAVGQTLKSLKAKVRSKIECGERLYPASTESPEMEARSLQVKIAQIENEAKAASEAASDGEGKSEEVLLHRLKEIERNID